MSDLLQIIEQAFEASPDHTQDARLVLEHLEDAGYRVVKQEQVGWIMGPENDPWLHHLNEGDVQPGERPVWVDKP